MSSTSNDCTRSIKRRKLVRLMCIDLTSDIENNSEEILPNKYQLSDITDSCQIEYNGEMIQFNVQQLKNIKKLGEGNFGQVNLTQLEHKPNVIFACKRITLEKHGNNSYSSESDLKAMRTVGNDHYPHIVDYYAALIDLNEGQLIICMEPLDASLDKFYPVMHSNVKPQNVLLDLFIRRLAKHIVLALNYLKSKNLIHRDIKPQNILVGRKSIFKLCDFGICGTLKDSLSSSHRGSLRYLPPERLGNVCSYGTRSDMWALGMTLLEISQGHLPLESEPIMSFMYHMKNGWQPDLPLTLFQSTRDLLSKLLCHDVNQRPRYYSDILLMDSMINIEDNPTENEVTLINKVIDLLEERTPE